MREIDILGRNQTLLLADRRESLKLKSKMKIIICLGLYYNLREMIDQMMYY